MTPEEQFEAINSKDWYTAMQAQGKAIIGAMQQAGFMVTQDGWIKTKTADIHVRMRFNDDRTVSFQVGEDAAGAPIFEWKAPQGWLV